MLCRTAGRFDNFGHFKAHFALDNLKQCNICSSETGKTDDQGSVCPAAARIQLADASRNQVHQNVRVEDYSQCFPDQFRVHVLLFFAWWNSISLLRGFSQYFVCGVVIAPGYQASWQEGRPQAIPGKRTLSFVETTTKVK